MATRQYTIEQLLSLRASPLVHKPDNLPAIEQWIDEGQQQQPQQREQTPRRPQRPGAADASPMGNFSTGSRPTLTQTRPGTNRPGDDISLGPPKTVFASSRNVSRLADFAEKSTVPIDHVSGEEGEVGGRSRFFGDKQANRKSTGPEEHEGRHTRVESWTLARERRALAAPDENGDGNERSTKYGRRDRDKEQDGERRNGHDEKHDQRWGYKDEKRQNSERPGGWRDRDREKKERDWGHGRVDKEPEWMEEPAPKQEDDLTAISQPKNQEDFEKWKQAQHARNKQPTDEPTSPPPEAQQPTLKDALPKPMAPFKLDIMDRPFGALGETRAIDSMPSPIKAAVAKGAKTSRFMPMFKKDEARDEMPPPPDTSPPPGAQQKPNDTVEDKEGFQRILQMLGNTTAPHDFTAMGPNSPPPKPIQQNGTKPKSRFTGFFDQPPKSPERMQAPQSVVPEPYNPTNNGMQQNGRGIIDEPSTFFKARMPNGRAPEQQPRIQAPAGAMSPNHMPPNNGARLSHDRPNEQFFDPPSRGAGTPEVNIQNLIAVQRNQRAGHQQGPDKNQDFLLNLLQTKGASRPASQQARPDGNFHPNQLWMEQPPPNLMEPKPRGPNPPPGHSFEDQLLRNHAQLEQQHQQQQPISGNDILQRRASQRAPPGFFDQQDLFLQQQQHHRRTFTEPPQQHGVPLGHRMGGHPSLPLMQMPPQQPPFPPQDFLQSPIGPQQAPPPGFNPHMPRHPPGFGSDIPNIFQAPQPPPPPLQQQQQQRQLPGFGMPGAMQPASPPNVPPGFFAAAQAMPAGPAGFMQMRSPAEVVAMGMRGRGRVGFDGYDGMGPRR